VDVPVELVVSRRTGNAKGRFEDATRANTDVKAVKGCAKMKAYLRLCVNLGT
jgi:hypothetical protein